MELHIIFGQTASSKSKIAFGLWQKYGYPILSVDSRKVYKGADIGTNKYTMQGFMKENPTMLVGGLDFLEPDEDVSAHIYQQYVYGWLAEYEQEIRKADGLVLHGGTGLYLDAILEGKSLLSPKNMPLRLELERLSLPELQAAVRMYNLERYAGMNESDKKNPRRLIRVIENKSVDVEKKVAVPAILQEAEKKWNLTSTSREEIYAIINARVLTYFTVGWLAEVESLLEKYGPKAQALQMMGYRQVVSFIETYPNYKELAEGASPEFEAMVVEIQQEHRRYAKRQETWLKKYKI